MGTSDLIPGVSGGTVALIVGVYERLIGSIAEITSRGSLRALRRGRVGAFWQAINGWFLVALVGGMAVAIFGFAGIIAWLLEHHATATDAVFFGLIARATWHVARDGDNGLWGSRAMFIPGSAVALAVVTQPSFVLEASPVTLMVGGALAATAMLLPGISGAFVLLILGLYATVVNGVAALDLAVLAPVGLGILLGAFSVARLMGSVLRRYPASTKMTLAGFMLGSLPAVWPFAQGWSADSSSPAWLLVILIAAGAGLVVLLERVKPSRP